MAYPSNKICRTLSYVFYTISCLASVQNIFEKCTMSVIKSQSFRYTNGSDMENFAHSLLMRRACSDVDTLTLWHLSDFCLSFLMHTWAVEASSRQESRCCSGCPQKRSRTFPKERHDSKMGHFSNTSLARSPQAFPRPRLTTGCYSWLLHTAT